MAARHATATAAALAAAAGGAAWWAMWSRTNNELRDAVAESLTRLTWLPMEDGVTFEARAYTALAKRPAAWWRPYFWHAATACLPCTNHPDPEVPAMPGNTVHEAAGWASTRRAAWAAASAALSRMTGAPIP